MDFFKYADCTTFTPLSGFRIHPYLKGTWEPLPPIKSFVVFGDQTILSNATIEVPSLKTSNGSAIDKKVRRQIQNFEQNSSVSNLFVDPKGVSSFGPRGGKKTNRGGARRSVDSVRQAEAERRYPNHPSN